MHYNPLQFNIDHLDAVFFDFDGVLVDSVSIKLSAYRDIFEKYGKEVVEEITTYHLANGGVDRYRKILYVLQKFSIPESNLENLASNFSQLVMDKVISAPSLPGMIEWVHFLNSSGKKIFIVSGTPQDELNTIVKKRGWESYFTEVRGSPLTKVEICRDILERYRLHNNRCIFVGDANTDFQTARECQIWFVGVPFP